MLLQQTHIDNAKREALQILEVENKTIYTLHQDMIKLIQTWKIEFEQIDTLLQRNTLSDQEKSKLLNIVDKKLTNPKKYGQD